MQSLRKFISTIILFLPFACFAHGYWIETAGSHKVKEPVTIRLYYGEYSMGERLSGSFLDKMNEIQVFARIPGGGQQAVSMKQLPDYWEGNFTPQSEGTYEIIGLDDTREVQDWTRHSLGIVRPIQYLKTIYQVGETPYPALFNTFLP